MRKQIVILLSALLVFLASPVVPAYAADTASQLADGAYDTTIEVLKDEADEVSATSQYVDSQAKVIVENGKTNAIVTLKSSAWWQSLQTQTVQPGSFDDDNFITAEVLSENEADNTRIVKFEVPDLNQVLNAKIHIIVTGVPGMGSYDHRYDIRLKFGQVDASETTTEAEEPEEEPAEEQEEALEEESAQSLDLQDGQYTIHYRVLHEEEDKDSSMARFMEIPAQLTVNNDDLLVTVTLTNHEQITAFQIEEGDSFVDAIVVSEDVEANTRQVAFEVTDLSAALNAKVQVYVAAQNYTGNHVIRLLFDPESVQGESTSDGSDIVFDDIQTSWAKTYIASLVAKDIIHGVSANRFAPDEHITRAQFAVLISRVLNLPKQEYEGTFSDVTENLAWAVHEIEAANRAGIVFGSGAEFHPAEPITREQMAAMIVRAIAYKDAALLDGVESTLVFADEAAIQDYAKEAVALAAGLGVIHGIVEENGQTHFAPADQATRAQAATVIYQLLEIL